MGAAAAAGIAATGAVAGGIISSSGAQSAAATQAAAQLQAAQMQQQTANQNFANLAPYNQNGQQALGNLNAQYGQTQNVLNSAFNTAQGAVPQAMTQAQLVQTPGYQFQLAQGLASTQAANAARGLGVSGAATKAAGQYATGLANSNYQTQFGNQQAIYGDQSQQFSNAVNQQNALYQQAYGPASLGENAAAQQGNQANVSAAMIGSNIAGAGASQATGIQSSANSLANTASSLGGAGYNYLAMNNALNNNSSGYADLPSGYTSVNGTGVQTPSADGSIAANQPYYTQ